jgi:hypothetical protein
VLLVIHSNGSADLWVDSAAVSLSILAKRDFQAGSAIFESDIADVTEMWFPHVNFQPTDRMIYLFRQDWRFGLYFDLRTEEELSVDEAARSLGYLYRIMRYRHIYDILKNETLLNKLMQAGWFPFVEIVGREIRDLLNACEAGFDLGEAETTLLAKFDDARLDRMFARWVAKPHFASKERILKSAIAAFKAQDAVAVLKIVLSEIEGVLAEAYRASVGQSAKIKALLKFAVESAEKKAGGPDTLLFPATFARYLENHTYAKFDPLTEQGTAGSRHAVGHGAADADSYTQVRALQALLTLDQIAFYT